MEFGLSEPLLKEKQRFSDFCTKELEPLAGDWDEQEILPHSLVKLLANQGWLVSTLPKTLGGAGHDFTTHGLLIEEIGRGCQSVRNLCGVQGMVAHTLERWGSEEQKGTLVPSIASGQSIAAFALTEPEGGSNARRIRTTIEKKSGKLILNGRKKWISFATIAKIFIVVVQCDETPAVVLVEAGTPGMTISPINGMLGLRASHLGEIEFSDCEIPAENLIADGPFTFDTIVTGGLDYGRFSTASGCVGLAQACLTASTHHIRTRGDDEAGLTRHQILRAKLTDMIVQTEAARLTCRKAAWLRDHGDPDAIMATLSAK